MSSKQSDIFNQNRFFWTVFGLWPGKIPNKYYRYYSIPYLIITFVAYNILLTLNLYCTPRKIEYLVREIIFFFTEIAVVVKICMVIFKREILVAIFDLLDCEMFKGNDDTGRDIINKYNYYYTTYLKFNTVLSNSSYFSQVLFPIIGYWLFNKNSLDLPICKYYFLSDETRNDYFVLIFLYQVLPIYGHMMYNVNIDSLVAGFMTLAVSQVKVLQNDLEKLKIDKPSTGSEGNLDIQQQKKLRKILRHYELVLKYCNDFEDIISETMFIQFGVGSATICVVMCGLLLASTVEWYEYISMVAYFMSINMEIFVPAWLGTQLIYESQDLMVAAYNSEWIPRSEPYKRSIKLFMERVKQPIIITGLKMFRMSLDTYISIVKTAYSCFTLVRIMQDRQEQEMH